MSNDIAQDWNSFTKGKSSDPILKYTEKKDGKTLEIEVRFEKFLAPPALVDPNFLNGNYKCGLAEAVDEYIQKCPINYRRKLYKNISLSEGSTLRPNFAPKLTADICGFLGGRGQAGVEVQLATNKRQKYVVWYGASKLASVFEFKDFYCSSRLIMKNMAVGYLGIPKRFPLNEWRN